MNKSTMWCASTWISSHTAAVYCTLLSAGQLLILRCWQAGNERETEPYNAADPLDEVQLICVHMVIEDTNSGLECLLATPSDVGDCAGT